MLTTRPRGTNDILPGETEKWQFVESAFRNICGRYGYAEIRIPMFEHTELFLRGVGETTDVVEKEMYTFTDRGGRSITLRPEGTASTVRAFLEHKLFAQPLPAKMYYAGPMFRYGRPQAGRLRQFHQVGVEVLGAKDPAVDAEVITLAMDFYGELGLQGLELRVNSVGCPHCRPAHRERLKEFLRPVLGELCDTCQGRYERNPMRILDCKSPRCQELVAEAPTTTVSLCSECDRHFRQVLKCLDQVGVNYTVDQHLVRGLDYYTNTTFEIVAAGIGAQSSIGGGGRYDGLVEECGGAPTPGIGFALGLERILLAMEDQNISIPVAEAMEVFVATIGPEGEAEAFRVLTELRRSGIRAEKDFMGRSLKAQLKHAGKFRARYTVFLGGEEFTRGAVSVRDMVKGIQEEVALKNLTTYLRQGLAL
ncbi:histidyl-tRNA synthetase [Clostridiales bacterium PH28_bin88]|nr:histidyl-tRNA synthetase [Clostridiales bacterium PH28_bin88]